MNDTIGVIVYLGVKLLYIFGIITYLCMFVLTTDNKDTMLKIISAGILTFFLINVIHFPYTQLVLSIS